MQNIMIRKHILKLSELILKNIDKNLATNNAKCH